MYENHSSLIATRKRKKGGGCGYGSVDYTYAPPQPPQPMPPDAFPHRPWCNGTCGGECNPHYSYGYSAPPPPPPPPPRSYPYEYNLGYEYHQPTHHLPPPQVVDDHQLHNQLVDRVKSYQRQSDTWKEEWTNYCGTHADGKKDPKRCVVFVFVLLFRQVKDNFSPLLWIELLRTINLCVTLKTPK